MDFQPTGLGHTIFKERYARHENETWEQACRRVAEHVAQAEENGKYEKYSERFYHELVANRFSPGGRIWYGAGRPKAQLLNCLHRKSPIITERGIVPIENIVPGKDRVLTEDGTFQLVVNKFSQGHRETLLQVNVKGMPRVLQVTPDHKFLTQRGWVAAGDLTSEDHVAVPGFKDERYVVPTALLVSAYLDEPERMEEQDGFLYQRNSGRSKNRTVGVFSKQVKSVKAEILVDLHLARFLGYYLSEGCAEKSGYRVIFTFGADEEEYVREVVTLFDTLFGLEAKVDRHMGWTQVSVSSKIVNQFMTNLIGPSFDRKVLPWWVLNTDEEFRMTLLAYASRGDGHTNINTGSTLLTMCNPSSMMQMFFLAQDLGIAHSLKYGIPREKHHAIPVSLNITGAGQNKNFINFSQLVGKYEVISSPYWRRIESVEEVPYNDSVWDISVEVNHSFQVAGMVAKNCFVLPSHDSREGWGDVVKGVIVISGLGGGVGINCSPVRPRGAEIKGTGGKATGAISLMQMIDRVGDVLVSGGGRRLALMLCLDINHPDLEEFLDVKLDLNELNNANISVMLNIPTDEFVRKIREGEDIELEFGGRPSGKTINAKDLWDRIVNNAWNSGEPGVLNGYLANQMNNIFYLKPLISTNPCGEIFLEEYGCCDLGALVLPRFIKEGEMDWDQLDETIRLSVRFLDDVLTVNHYPMTEIKENSERVRRIGLGVMGLHTMLLELGLKYSSLEAQQFVDKLFNFIKNTAYDTSINLSIEKGPFPAFRAEFLQSGFAKTLKKGIRNKIKEYGIRNCALLTIAPTGTTGLVADVSTGIEPYVAAVYWRHYKGVDDQMHQIMHKELVVRPEWEKYGSLCEGIADLTPRDHFEMQKIVQKHIDNAVSKTINAPPDITSEELSEIWLEYLPYCKGTTLYRSGSREFEPIVPIPVAEIPETIEGYAERATMVWDEHERSFIDHALEVECPNGVCDLPVVA